MTWADLERQRGRAYSAAIARDDPAAALAIAERALPWVRNKPLWKERAGKARDMLRGAPKPRPAAKPRRRAAALPEDVQETCIKRYADGESVADIARDLGIKERTVRRVFERRGLRLRRRRLRDFDETVLAMYRAGKRRRDIADELKLTRKNVTDCLRRCGVAPVRTGRATTKGGKDADRADRVPVSS